MAGQSDPILYQTPLSPPSRAVLVTAKALGLKLDVREVNLMNGEQFSPEFIKINPQHTVPVLVDTDGTVIWDSHAIVTYLAEKSSEKYDERNRYYPKNLAIRAKIDQRLHFDSSVIFPTMKRIVQPILRQGKKTIDQELLDEMEGAFGFLENFLVDGEYDDWIAGNRITVADFCLLTSLTAADVLVPIDGTKYPKLKSWMLRGQQIPAYSANLSGLQMAKDIFKKLLS